MLFELSFARLAAVLLVCLFVAPLIGCADKRLRSREEIEAERRALPALYMTESGKRIQAPPGQGAFVDSESNEIAYPVFVCTNPDCPAKGDEPQLFIHPDANFSVGPDGKLKSEMFATKAEYDAARKAKGYPEFPSCPACRKAGVADPNNKEEYVLPETAKRRKELKAELKLWDEYIRKRALGEV